MKFYLFFSVLSLQELCCRAIVARTTVYSIEQLPLPTCVKSHLKSYAMTSSTQTRYAHNRNMSNKGTLGHRRLRFIVPSSGLSTPTSPQVEPASCTGRNSCTLSWHVCKVRLCVKKERNWFTLLKMEYKCHIYSSKLNKTNSHKQNYILESFAPSFILAVHYMSCPSQFKTSHILLLWLF